MDINKNFIPPFLNQEKTILDKKQTFINSVLLDEGFAQHEKYLRTGENKHCLVPYNLSERP